MLLDMLLFDHSEQFMDSQRQAYFHDRPNILLVQIDVKILMILIINISNSNNLNKYWVGIFKRQGQINQVY